MCIGNIIEVLSSPSNEIIIKHRNALFVTIFGWIFLSIVTYLIIAFSLMELNPALWEINARVFLGVFSGFFACVSYITGYESWR